MALRSVLCALVLAMTGPAAAIEVPSTPADVVEVVLRAFLPAAHPSLPGFVRPVVAEAGRTMLPPDPRGLCIGTDDRSFSADRLAAARFGGVVSLAIGKRAVEARPIRGRTIAYDCATGIRLCAKTSGEGAFRITGVTRTASRIEVRYAAAAADPCLTFGPTVEFSGTVVFDLAAGTAAVRGKVDCFPAFEALLVRRNGSVAPLYAVDPAPRATESCLATAPAGGGREVVSAALPY